MRFSRYIFKFFIFFSILLVFESCRPVVKGYKVKGSKSKALSYNKQGSGSRAKVGGSQMQRFNRNYGKKNAFGVKQKGAKFGKSAYGSDISFGKRGKAKGGGAYGNASANFGFATSKKTTAKGAYGSNISFGKKSKAYSKKGIYGSSISFGKKSRGGGKESYSEKYEGQGSFAKGKKKKRSGAVFGSDISFGKRGNRAGRASGEQVYGSDISFGTNAKSKNKNQVYGKNISFGKKSSKTDKSGGDYGENLSFGRSNVTGMKARSKQNVYDEKQKRVVNTGGGKAPGDSSPFGKEAGRAKASSMSEGGSPKKSVGEVKNTKKKKKRRELQLFDPKFDFKGRGR